MQLLTLLSLFLLPLALVAEETHSPEINSNTLRMADPRPLDRAREKCLPSEKNESWKITRRFDVAKKTKKQVEALPLKMKQQIIIAAKDWEKKFNFSRKIESTWDAVQELKENGLDVIHYEVGGKKVTEVLTEQGASIGIFFDSNTLRIIARETDGSITCE